MGFSSFEFMSLLYPSKIINRRNYKFSRTTTSICSLAILVSRCCILRLPCKIEASFGVSATDRALINNNIRSYTVNNVQQCFYKCTDDHNGCKSVNYKQLGLDSCNLASIGELYQPKKASQFCWKNLALKIMNPF